MRSFTIRFVVMVVIAALVVGCGRRLPDEYFETNTSVTESDTPAEVAVASDVEDTSDDAEATEIADAADEDTSEAPEATEPAETDSDADVADEDATEAETVAEDEATEPEMVLVEVPADPIVEQVANADPVNGEALFNAGVTCTSCHLVESEDRLVGPGLLNIPQHAETRVEGDIAERYLYNSIVLPNDFVVEGYPAAMYAGYNDDYTEEEVLDIVAYLMTLGDYPEREPVFMEVAAESVDEVADVAGDADVVEDAVADTETESTEDVVEEADDATEDVAEATEEAVEAEAEATEEAVADAESDSEEMDDTAEATPEVIVIVVTATPSAEAEAPEDDVADDGATEAETTEVVDDAVSPADMTFEPAYTLDYSAVPQTINALAQYGSVTAGENIFVENCASCHTLDGTGDSDLGMVGSIEDAPSYIWATTYSEEVHGELATDFARDISAAEAAHLVAYLLSQSEMQADE